MPARKPINNGDVFGDYTVTSLVSTPSGRLVFLRCIKCQTERTVQVSHLPNTCQACRPRFNKRLYSIWSCMVRRCHDENCKSYANYGARGISVHPTWRVFAAFEAYISSELGERPPGHELDRINNDGNYEPGNVRWATRLENARNKSTRTDRYLGGVVRGWVIKEFIGFKQNRRVFVCKCDVCGRVTRKPIKDLRTCSHRFKKNIKGDRYGFDYDR